MTNTRLPMAGICHQCAQLTDECTCPAREHRQRLVELARSRGGPVQIGVVVAPIVGKLERELREAERGPGR